MNQFVNQNSQNWICCQLGAREHYSIPRALHQHQKLFCLITDTWVHKNSFIKLFKQKSLNDRFHPALSQANIYSFNSSIIQFEIIEKIRSQDNWGKIIARNAWFQHQAIRQLVKIAPKLNQFNQPPIIFAYSYAALEIFKFAKKQGWLTILGQIDPGILEEKIVIAECQQYPQYVGNWQPAPTQYWQDWQQECQLADIVLVNSDWSDSLLCQAGVEQSKLRTIPLVYANPNTYPSFKRIYPESFNRDRPLRVLFLGQVILRKGVAHLLEAINLLQDYPIEFWIVGSVDIDVAPNWQTHPKIKWIGQINRSDTAKYYQKADVFVLPTLSDGFGLTQLEAQAWHLPIIASRNCGNVVIDDVNGYLLSEVSGEAIACIIRKCLDTPATLDKLSQASKISQEFSLSNLADKLTNIF